MDAKLFIDLLTESEDYLLDIHTAANIGCDERVHDIIESSERKNIVDERNKKGWTPLMYAACCANMKVALFLIEVGAQTGIKNCEGQTALVLAAKCGSGDLVNLLIDNGAPVNDRDLRGWTALFYATSYGHRSVVQLLIERGAFVDIADDNEKMTPLMLAAAAGHGRIVQDFLHLGVNINIECKSGDTARSLAIKNGYNDVKNLIDSYLHSKRKNIGQNLQCHDLPSLLKELQLSKYYHFFEEQNIDLGTFFLLTDDDLKEIGIQLLGPRKKMCMAIAQYQHEQSKKKNLNEAANLENFRLEQKKFQLLSEKLKAIALQEKNARLVLEHTLAEVRSSRKNNEMMRPAMNQAMDSLQKLKEKLDYTTSVVYSTLQDMNVKGDYLMKLKIDSIFQLLNHLQVLLEVHYQNMTSLQSSC